MLNVENLVVEFEHEGYAVRPIDGLGFVAEPGELVVLLGPSGSGKTTLLSCLGGILTPTAGTITLEDTTITELEKSALDEYRRGRVGFVFQAFNLVPSLSAVENIAVPLMLGGHSRRAAFDRADELIGVVGLGDRAHYRPGRLSGGQQQRVALARALVAEPKVILFDEPLSNLDAKLREETRKELRSFLSELQITAVYVTHDRIEALALSDLIAVMRAGKIIEIGDPKKIYFNSDHKFVADFIGRANLIKGKVSEQQGNHAVFSTEIGTIVALNSQGIATGQDAMLCIRPEFIQLAPEQVIHGHNVFKGKMETLIFIGEAYEGEIRIGETLLTTTIEPTANIGEGDTISIAFDPDHCFLLSA